MRTNHRTDYRLQITDYRKCNYELQITNCRFLGLICNLLFVIFLLQFGICNLRADAPTAQFLLVGQGARAQAMGESAVSNCFDYSALYWNPAASVFLSNPELGINYNQLPAEIDSNYLSFIYPYKKIALGVRAITEQTKVPGFDNNGNTLGDINNADSNFNIVFAYKILDSLSAGLGFGPVNMQLDTEKKDTTNANIGTIFKKDRFSAGIAIANLGGKFTSSTGGESQPTLLRAGGSYSFLKNLLVSASLETVLDDKNAGGVGAGVEYFIIKSFAIRCGSKFQNDGAVKPSFGFGLNFKRIFLDYAFNMASSELKDTEQNHVGLSFKFGKEKEEAAEFERPAARVEKPERKPGEITNIAVADFSGKNVSAADASIVADFLRTELVNIGIYNVIEKANMEKILAEAAFQQSGCTTAECAVQIGKLLNVKQMVVGSLSKLMDTYYITVNLVDVETGKIAASYDQDATSAKELRTACRMLAQKLSK